MEFLELAKKRYSVRKYSDQKISQDHIELILEAGSVAPTAANKQPYHMLVVNNEEGLSKIKKTANIYGAPLAIIVCAKKSEAWTRPYDNKNLADVDSTIVTDHMMLQSASLGLGSLWVCYFDPAILKAEFTLPEDLEPLHILGVGHADEEPLSPDRHTTARKSIKQTVSYEIFES